MGRGISSGGGESSLGYLFGGTEAPAPKPAARNTAAPAPQNPAPAAASPVVQEKPSASVPPAIPAGIQGSQKNNYHRADGQNTGNFLTDRPSTKVHAAPGGGSSLGYLFGDGSK